MLFVCGGGHQQTLISGGKHGELCFWDLRQRQLRSSVRAFDASATVKALALDPYMEFFVAGSSDGDIKVGSFVKLLPYYSSPKLGVHDDQLPPSVSQMWSLNTGGAAGGGQLLCSLTGDHQSSRSGGGAFGGLRGVGAGGQVHGVQQLHLDTHQRLFSCGGDASLKLRHLPSVLGSLLD